jgi:dipeptidyl-peptidase-4
MPQRLLTSHDFASRRDLKEPHMAQRWTRPFVLLAGLCIWSIATAQSPPASKTATFDSSFLDEFVQTRGYMLGRPVRPTPTPDGSAVLFLRAKADEPAQDLFEFNAATGQTRLLLTAATLLKGGDEALSPEETARRERQRLQARGLASFTLFDHGKQVLIPLAGRLYLYVRATAQVSELPTQKGPLDPQVSPDGKKLAYVADHDVWVMDLGTKQEWQLTRGGTAEVTHGEAEFIAQEEMHRHSGFWWTADSKHILYEEADLRDVEIWRIADPTHPEGKPSEQRYPRPGRNNARVRLGCIPAAGGDTVWIRWNAESYPYLATVKCDEGGPPTICVQDRLQQEMQVLAVDIQQGDTRLLLAIRDPAWVNIDPAMPRWLKDGSGFIWSRDGEAGGQLELHATGAPAKQEGKILVPAENNFMELVSVDEAGSSLTYISGRDVLERHLHRLHFERKDQDQRLTKSPGIHRAVFSKNHALYVLTSSDAGSMPRTTVHRADGTLIGELPSVAKEPPFQPTTEFVTVGPEPGFNCAVTRPRHFDVQRRYPVINTVYGGPTVQTVLRTMGPFLLSQWMADQGFIVVAIDNRGTPGRGRSWERAIYRNFGAIPINDQASALKALGEKMPELDLTRVGIRGWSFGGYMAALGVLRRPDVFHAAVAGAPVTDWEDYDTHYTERYLGLPKDNPAGYKNSSLLPLAPKLSRPLLLIHGTADDNVYFVHSLKLADALIRADKHFEVLPLAGMTHAIRDPLLRRRVEERSMQFFKSHLGEPREQDSTGFRHLFNGKDLTGWVKEAKEQKDGTPRWTVTSAGELRCEAGLAGFGFLRYDREQFSDFILRLEYRFEPERVTLFSGNSGIGIRTGKFDPARSSATRPSYAAYEVQLLDDAGKPANKNSTGSLYRYAAPTKNAAKPAPEWNALEITCSGPRIKVRLNGDEILDVVQTQLEDLSRKPVGTPPPKEKPLSGYIALQSHSGTVYFRNICIQPTGP